MAHEQEELWAAVQRLHARVVLLETERDVRRDNAVPDSDDEAPRLKMVPDDFLRGDWSGRRKDLEAAFSKLKQEP